MYGDREITKRMVFSVITQYIPKDNPFKIHLVLVDDYIEERGEDNSSPYDWYLENSEFLAMYDHDKIKITLLKNDEHKYQGESREIGFNAGDYPYFVLLDCDDMLPPNACCRYLNIIDDALEKEDAKPVSNVHGLLYSFGDRYENNIPGRSIWVQSRCYNRDFIHKHDIHFPTGLSSRQGEDYPFIRMLDYAVAHDPDYQVLSVPYESNKDCQATCFWFPNEASLSRRDAHYGQHLSGWTMHSSSLVLDYFFKFNKIHGIETAEDEYMKHECLNMVIYSYFNLLDFLREVSATDYVPLEEDWEILQTSVDKLRQMLLDTYYPEIIYSDIEDMLFHVRHNSDCRQVEPWHGNFYDYMSTRWDILDASYDDMIQYCKGLEFDSAGHEIHSKQVQAWIARHQ